MWSNKDKQKRRNKKVKECARFRKPKFDVNLRSSLSAGGKKKLKINISDILYKNKFITTQNINTVLMLPIGIGGRVWGLSVTTSTCLSDKLMQITQNRAVKS